MSDFEKKVYKINQTEKLLSSLISGWKNYYDSFEELREEIRKANWRERNPIIATCGFMASVLLALISTDHITMSEFQTYLAIDGIIAFLVFIGYGIYNLVLVKTTQNVEVSLIHAIGNLDGLQNHFLALTYDIDKIKLSELEDLFVFVMLAEGSNKIRIHRELGKIAKLKRLPSDVSQEIKRSIDVWESGIKTSIESFDEVKDEFEKDEWKAYLFYIEDLINYNKTRKTEKQDVNNKTQTK